MTVQNSATIDASVREKSMLFQPLKIGELELQHRVIQAPMTRSRGVPLNSESTPENPNRAWYPGDLMVNFYGQRATKGGLIISEGMPPSLESNGMPGVSGLWLPEQEAGWKRVVDAIHEKGGYVFGQIWHAGRTTIPQMTGSPTLCPSATVWDCPTETYMHPPVGSTERVRIADHPPIEMTVPHIKKTIQDYVTLAKKAREIGFDGLEVHAGNGYLPEQFLSTNINKRTDEYGGSIEKNCTFTLELMDELSKAIGEEHLGVRLTPFGMMGQARSEKRIEIWSHLCENLAKRHPNLGYVHFIEPRYEQAISYEDKDKYLASQGLTGVTLEPFRKLLGSIPVICAGGFNNKTAWGVIESGKYDGLVFGRPFVSNPDFVHRLRNGIPLSPPDPSRFFGPFPDDNAIGYCDYPTAEEKMPEVVETPEEWPQIKTVFQ
ncbi:hypothetical protein AJ79_05365 [Helicocarpus griseus UAMH5409]|uniref:NADH:flavin oxidoreductase/NADH oxidase N-terminal domain-containing protein n=1 Tax=Helicocarpus griseus UAMH5409 TaxID=1447875 RepID=A0A2B7XPF4_9EURO|nr:hypothetical protein AJ79_05365 [Helicocarpus griseus UAMH5409]